MGKSGIKDPNPTTTGRIVSAIFSKTTAATIGAVIGYKKLPQVLNSLGIFNRLELLFNINLSSQHEDISNEILAVVVGLTAGVGAHRVGSWLRLRIIKILLSYHGWLFHSRAKSTMLWGMMLKLMVGPGPHRTMEFQSIMPKLPIPPVEDSCQRYLKVIKPLLSKEDYQHSEQLVNDFLNGDAQVLQKYLKDRDKKMTSWLADWWTESAYLARRESVAINANFFVSSKFIEEIPCNPIARAATCLYNAMRYQDMIIQDILPPDLVMDTIPVCMNGSRYLFSSCRIPGEHIDRLERYPESTHAVVNCKGVYFRLEMYEKDSKGKMVPLTKLELKKQLEYIVNETKDVDVPKRNAIAVLTTQNRTVWARHRKMLQENPVNASILKDIESAIFFQAIGVETPKNFSHMARLLLTGDGTTRWFDKSNTLEIFKDTTMGGSNMEHSGADATHSAVMWEHALQMENYGPDGDIPRVSGEHVRELPPPKKLDWQLDYMQEIIDNALIEYRETVAALDHIITQTRYGKRYMKSRKVSPDGFLQMALQLAYWRMHKHITKTYEPASTRLFAFGRTDNINPVSEESIKWVKMMDDGKSSRADIIKMMRGAIKYQSNARLECTAGYGCERHLLGLSMAAKELGIKRPALFDDKAFNLPMKLSTSQVPTNIGNHVVTCIPESLLGGFGPGCPGGYGLLYCSIGDDMFNFSITSWKTCPETDSTKFSNAMHTALEDMKHLMDGTGIYTDKLNNKE